ncbi:MULTISPECIES: YIP1 family protein [Caproicibacterium]|uniref:YIP1 family protein n=1 Tax=Caproicibacterium argilliputei TaxID=3030016 RepID=A0AA97D9I2_9FIRM|nr:YIP1 family protein [Caproicibacterium argilliputei]WOC31540.1 YIP1 family protein [Caproicibacterium argilliputei]
MEKLKAYFALPKYVLFHPVDGFYNMKYEKQGHTSIIFVNLILFWISYSFLKQYTGFIINPNDPLSYNTFADLGYVSLAFLLWCAGSWSVTSLMDGDGTFRDIAMAASLSLTPMILFFIPVALLSNVMTADEAAFYHVLIGIAIVWFLMLMFSSVMTIHNYSVAKTFGMLFLTFLSICIILFLTVMIASLIQQFCVFVKSIYTELLYRM